MRKTKIVCTIGPSSESKENLGKLVSAGMNVMRLNFSHGDFEEHGGRIRTLREILAETGKNVAILLDTKGPEIRTMQLEGGSAILEAGQTFTLTTDQSVTGNSTRVAVTYEKFTSDVKAGDTVLLDDGLLELKVIEIKGGEAVCRVMNTGELGNKKGVNLPGSKVALPAISEKDKGDLLFGCEQKVDFIAASFIRKAADVLEIRELLKANGGADIQIISKIENQEGVDNFEEILAVSDGIMVARGDLGVEIPVEEVIFAQKMMIQKCNEARKPVITATQMLESMIKNPRPTRAEAGDVTNAILDGTDAVMLSGESAKGKYPSETVRIMAQICERTDTAMKQRNPTHVEEFHGNIAITESICKSAVRTSTDLHIDLIVVSTLGGKSVKSVRKYFPRAQIVALTTIEKTFKQLSLIKGVTPKLVEAATDVDTCHTIAKEAALSSGFVSKGQNVVIVSGALLPGGSTNAVSVYRL